MIEQVEYTRRPDGKLTSTISSPIQVHGITKVPAKRAPEIGEHTQRFSNNGWCPSSVRRMRPLQIEYNTPSSLPVRGGG